jgi:hypothetical protein
MLKESMSVSRLHYCIDQIRIAERTLEPPAAKCLCKKYIPLSQATEMVRRGEASWVVIKRSQEAVEAVCSLCHGDPEVKNCANCGGKGKVSGTAVIEDYGNDLVLISTPPADKREKKRSSALAKRTPRVATIESEHLERAYSGSLTKDKPRQWRGQGQEARDRIEEYGRLILDARMFVGKARIPAIVAEPEDDQSKGQGRRFDYGRAI